MIFSRICRSLSRSTRSQALLYGDGTPTNLNRLIAPRTQAHYCGAEGGLGILRGYSVLVGARKSFVSNLSDVRYLLANPRQHRLYSSECPKKKNYENFYPKDKKESPKGSEQKSESKGFAVWRWDPNQPEPSHSAQNFYRKDKKESPKGSEQKSESKGREREIYLLEVFVGVSAVVHQRREDQFVDRN